MRGDEDLGNYKIKIFCDDFLEALEDRVNEWLKREENIEITDVKTNTNLRQLVITIIYIDFEEVEEILEGLTRPEVSC